MAIRFQYNKTSLGELGKQLKTRQRALPTIKSKESALRIEVKRAKDTAADYVAQLDSLLDQYNYMVQLWGEFDADLLSIGDVDIGVSKIAGVKIPVLGDIHFVQKEYDMFSSPIWFTEGVSILKQIATLGIEYEVYERKTQLLDYARKKTTQKVNLYEKVQIPGYEDAIRKIKRFLEDEENLSKSAQKIVKTRHESTNSAGL